jgi:hypothetical protein
LQRVEAGIFLVQVVYGCWRTDPTIAAWMAANGFAAGDYNALLAYFVKRADAIVQKLGAQPMHWEEVRVCVKVVV